MYIEESNVRGLEEIESGKQHIRTKTHQHCHHECAFCAAKIHALEERQWTYYDIFDRAITIQKKALQVMILQGFTLVSQTMVL